MRLLLVIGSDEYTFDYFRFTVEGVDVEQGLFKEKRMRNYKNKHVVASWTIENEEQMHNVIPYSDTITYQFIDPKIVKEALKR